MASELDIAEGIHLLKVAFPNYQPDPKATAQLWMASLGDLDPGLLRSAIMAAITERGRAFAPSIGEIRGIAVNLIARAQGIPSSLQAYDEVVKMPGDMDHLKLETEDGVYWVTRTKVNWSHPFVGEVARLMGWPRRFPTDQPGVDRAQWVKAYDSELNRLLDNAIRLPSLEMKYGDRDPFTQKLITAINEVTQKKEIP